MPTEQSPADRGGLPAETALLSFLVRLWIEETAEESAQAANGATWRGHVTHMPSGERRYVQDLGEITAFIRGYLEQAGVNASVEAVSGRRWLGWLRRK